MSAGAMEQFDECGSLVHGGEMVRLGDEMTKKSLLEGQLTAPTDVTQAKSFFGKFEAPAPPVDSLPGLSVAEPTLPTTDIASGAIPSAGIDGGALAGADLTGGAIGAPGGFLSGMFEILTEVMTSAPLDPNQALNIGQSG